MKFDYSNAESRIFNNHVGLGVRAEAGMVGQSSKHDADALHN